LLAFFPSSQVTTLSGMQVVVAWPEAQEASDLLCDTGTDLHEIQVEFENLPVDFGLVESGWHIKV